MDHLIDGIQRQISYVLSGPKPHFNDFELSARASLIWGKTAYLYGYSQVVFKGST